MKLKIRGGRKGEECMGERSGQGLILIEREREREGGRERERGRGERDTPYCPL